jgi:hypothetical protein
MGGSSLSGKEYGSFRMNQMVESTNRAVSSALVDKRQLPEVHIQTVLGSVLCFCKDP